MSKKGYTYRFFISIAALIILYSFGVYRMLQEGPSGAIIKWTPLTLCITTLALFVCQKYWNLKIVFGIILVFILGLAIEIVGVNTGFPFGNYHYSSILGTKVYNTPIVIGVNWLMLVYSATFFFKVFIRKNWLIALISAILLLALDVLIEPVAKEWGLWSWDVSLPPKMNFIAWGVIAFVLSYIFCNTIDKKNFNKLAGFVLLLQALFFITLEVCY